MSWMQYSYFWVNPACACTNYVPPGYILGDSGLCSAGLYPQWLRTIFRRAMSSVAHDSGLPGKIFIGAVLFRRVIYPATEDYFVGLYPQWLRTIVPRNTVSNSRPFHRVISMVVSVTCLSGNILIGSVLCRQTVSSLSGCDARRGSGFNNTSTEMTLLLVSECSEVGR